MVTIRRVSEPDGTRYCIDDFAAYVEELRMRGIDPPPTKYHIFISDETMRAIKQSSVNVEAQIALFFRISPSTGIVYKVLPSSND